MAQQMTLDVPGSSRWREEIAWAAGYFDGEGHVSAAVTPKRRGLVVVVANSHYPGLYRFQRAVLGLGAIYPARGTNVPTWQWRVSSLENVQAVMAMLWPFLGEEKRMKFAETMARYLGRPEPDHMKSRVFLWFEEFTAEWRWAKFSPKDANGVPTDPAPVRTVMSPN